MHTLMHNKTSCTRWGPTKFSARGEGGGYTRHHLSDEPHGQNLLTLNLQWVINILITWSLHCQWNDPRKFESYSWIYCLIELELYNQDIIFQRWGMEGTERDHYLFLWDGGPRLSKIALNVSPSTLILGQPAPFKNEEYNNAASCKKYRSEGAGY